MSFERLTMNFREIQFHFSPPALLASLVGLIFKAKWSDICTRTIHHLDGRSFVKQLEGSEEEDSSETNEGPISQPSGRGVFDCSRGTFDCSSESFNLD